MKVLHEDPGSSAGFIWELAAPLHPGVRAVGATRVPGPMAQILPRAHRPSLPRPGSGGEAAAAVQVEHIRLTVFVYSVSRCVL